jgi:chemotaxis protein MotB
MPDQASKPTAEPPPPTAPRRPTPAPRRHGGAWKVAYADFVTALMALFIVLWLMSASEQVKKSVSGYFRDPRGYTHRLGAGPGGSGEGLMIGKAQVDRLQEEIRQALHRVPEFHGFQNNVQISATGEGLRIDLLETEQGLFFAPAGPEPTLEGEHLLAALAQEIRRMPNPVVIEGHTDARPFRNGERYGNWELSTERANAARRLLLRSGIRPDQVVEVRGFADHKLLKPAEPNDASNRRISLVLRFTE